MFFVVAVAAAGSLAAAPASAGTIGVNCGSANLLARIEAAPAGSTLLIKGTCMGNFAVAKTLTLKGNPQGTLDGQDVDGPLHPGRGPGRDRRDGDTRGDHPGAEHRDAGAGAVDADQRGVPRPQGPACNIGAFERTV
ncbi:MAG TPA: choice-of-anchor Q domain-containing protein [Actinomycetota bacterium]